MKLGTQVEGLFTDNWRFVEEDLHDITERVKQYDEAAALVRHESGYLGIARYVYHEISPGGVWLIAFTLSDPASADGHWYGEPDGRVIEQMARGDMQKRDPQKMARNVKRMLMLHEAKLLQQAKEQVMGDPEVFVHRYRKMEGQKRKIVVPS